MNIKINKVGRNLRDKFQMNEPIRIYHYYGVSTLFTSLQDL